MRLDGIIWILTGRCNLDCLHCYAKRFTQWVPEVDKDTVERVLKEGISLGLRWVNFSGGEILIYKRWILDLFKELLDSGVYPSLVTNGTAITRKVAEKLRGVYVYVSVDGPEDVHEAVRGKGTWKTVLKGIENLRELDIDFAIIMAINQLNYNRVLEVGELAWKLGAREFIVIPTMPFGQAKEYKLAATWEQFLFSLRQMNEFLELYDGISGGSWCAPWSKFIVKSKRFHAGNCRRQNTLDIGPDGSVLLCDVLDIKLGNVRQSPLKDLWEQYVSHPLVVEVRKPRGLYCSKCPHFTKCLGGCYARALVSNGSFEGDPLCPFFNNGLKNRVP